MNTTKNMPQRKNKKINLSLLLLLLFAGLVACTSRVVEKVDQPDDLIPRDTMVSIFVDLRLLDAVVNFEQRKGSKKINEINYYLHNSILEKYRITREQFESSFTFYQSDLEVIDGIYADAITQLTLLKSKIEQE